MGIDASTKKSLTDRTAGELTNTKWRICHWRRPLGIQIKSSRAEPPLTQGLGQAKVMIDHVVLIKHVKVPLLRQPPRGADQVPGLPRQLLQEPGPTPQTQHQGHSKAAWKELRPQIQFAITFQVYGKAFFVSQRPVACRLEGKPEAAELTREERMIQQFRMLLVRSQHQTAMLIFFISQMLHVGNIYLAASYFPLFMWPFFTFHVVHDPYIRHLGMILFMLSFKLGALILIYNFVQENILPVASLRFFLGKGFCAP